jgi:hypothetical protein
MKPTEAAMNAPRPRFVGRATIAFEGGGGAGGTSTGGGVDPVIGCVAGGGSEAPMSVADTFEGLGSFGAAAIDAVSSGVPTSVVAMAGGGGVAPIWVVAMGSSGVDTAVLMMLAAGGSIVGGADTCVVAADGVSFAGRGIGGGGVDAGFGTGAGGGLDAGRGGGFA